MKNPKVYGIWDTKGETYSQMLMIYAHHAAAIRYFDDVGSAENTTVNKHPEDYELHYIGTFDDTNALHPSDTAERVLLTGAQWNDNRLQAQAHR